MAMDKDLISCQRLWGQADSKNCLPVSAILNFLQKRVQSDLWYIRVWRIFLNIVKIKFEYCFLLNKSTLKLIFSLFDYVLLQFYFTMYVSHWCALYRIKRGNGEHTEDTTLRPEMKTATHICMFVYVLW